MKIELEQKISKPEEYQVYFYVGGIRMTMLDVDRKPLIWNRRDMPQFLIDHLKHIK